MQEEQQDSFEITECSPPVSTIVMGVPQRGSAPRTMCPQDCMLFWSFVLLVAHLVMIYELYKNSMGVSSSSLGNITGIYNNSN